MTTVLAQIFINGFHNYPNAPNKVKFLSLNHRHTFKIICAYKVINLNREREIFMCSDEIKDYLFEAYGTPCQFGSMSCEMIASEILEFGKDDGMVWVEVWEEETGGARVEI